MKTSMLLSVVVIAVSLPCVAEDVYWVGRLRELTVIDGDPKVLTVASDDFRARWWTMLSAYQPYGTLDSEGEIYLAREPGTEDARFGIAQYWHTQNRVAIRVSDGADVTGLVFVPRPDLLGMVRLRFRVTTQRGDGAIREEFLKVKQDHYSHLLDRGQPGGAWFRHQLRLTQEALGVDENAADERRQRMRRSRVELEETYDLISGGRALSENLQLDRVLPEAEPEKPTVPIDTIPGITVREFDWRAMTEGLQPDVDPLAAVIPDDQHALFFPSFQAMIDLADQAADHGAPVLAAMEPRAEDASTRARYERQLALPASELARVIGPHVVRSVAITGGDPYLRTGSDLAVLFEPKTDVRALYMLIAARIALAKQEHPEAQILTGNVDGVTYSAVRSSDRVICSYVAIVGNAVVVTNSPAQLERLVNVQNKKISSLASLPEYTFFRDRYRRDAAGETALLILSDKTIRRWCGPRWRIGTSRRTRAVALMTDLQAANMHPLVGGSIEAGPLQPARTLPDIGELRLNADGVISSVHGTLSFQTPIGELNIERVTPAEMEAYKRWRVSYQRYWREFFDPIAIRFQVGSDRLTTDVTVMPLIAGTDYQEIIEASRGAAINPDQADLHAGTLLHLVLALNRDSPPLKQSVTWAMSMAPQLQANPLSWL